MTRKEAGLRHKYKVQANKRLWPNISLAKEIMKFKNQGMRGILRKFQIT